MSKFIKSLKTIVAYALVTVGVIWSFSWSTHTIAWMIGAFLFFIFIIVATVAKMFVDTIKPLKDGTVS